MDSPPKLPKEGLPSHDISHVEYHRPVDIQDDDEGPTIPSVNERLGYLRPSRELLEYYRKKIAEFDGEHEDMLNRLDQYKMTYEQQVLAGFLLNLQNCAMSLT